MPGEPSFVRCREDTGKSGDMRPAMRIADHQVNGKSGNDLGWTKQPHISRFHPASRALPKRQPCARTSAPDARAKRFEPPSNFLDRPGWLIRISPPAIQRLHADKCPRHDLDDIPRA